MWLSNFLLEYCWDDEFLGLCSSLSLRWLLECLVCGVLFWLNGNVWIVCLINFLLEFCWVEWFLGIVLLGIFFSILWWFDFFLCVLLLVSFLCVDLFCCIWFLMVFVCLFLFFWNVLKLGFLEIFFWDIKDVLLIEDVCFLEWW